MTNTKEEKKKSGDNKKKAKTTETTKEKSRKIEFEPGNLYNNIPSGLSLTLVV